MSECGGMLGIVQLAEGSDYIKVPKLLTLRVGILLAKPLTPLSERRGGRGDDGVTICGRSRHGVS